VGGFSKTTVRVKYGVEKEKVKHSKQKKRKKRKSTEKGPWREGKGESKKTPLIKSKGSREEEKGKAAVKNPERVS